MIVKQYINVLDDQVQQLSRGYGGKTQPGAPPSQPDTETGWQDHIFLTLLSSRRGWMVLKSATPEMLLDDYWDRL